MKRRIFAMLGLVFSLCGLAACASPSESATPTPTEIPLPEIEVFSRLRPS